MATTILHAISDVVDLAFLTLFFVVVFQDSVMLNGFGTVVNALGKRVKPYLPQICGTVLWRLNNKSAKVRQQAADLISRTAVVMKTCQEVFISPIPPFHRKSFLNERKVREFLLTFTSCYLVLGKTDGTLGCCPV